MNRSLLTIAAYFVIAIAVIGLMRWLRSRSAAPPTAALTSRAPGPTGPPLAGTSLPLPASLEPHRAALERLLAPALRLQPGGAPVARLGGVAKLPPGMAWPASPTRPMSFVGELDLAALHAASPEVAAPLPDDGRLALFYDVEEMRWGGDPKDGAFVRLVHLVGGAQPRGAPPGATTFPERVLGATAVRVLPGSEDLPAGLRLSDEADEAYFEHVAGLAPEPDHRVGGHPAWIQNDGREDAAIAAVGGSSGTPELVDAARAKLSPGPASDWRLLWQIDSDDAAGFMWGDAGRLYLLARDADLKARRFDRVWLVLQCY